jgi:hypothetical protein
VQVTGGYAPRFFLKIFLASSFSRFDGAARQWEVDYRTTVTYLCSRLIRDFTEDK